jgi:hypothetical protein
MPKGFTPETAREAGRKGGAAGAVTKKAEARVRQAVRADMKAKLKFEAAAEKLASVLIDAALGNGDFEKLEPRERAGFAVKALEYGVGRPRPEAERPPEATKQPGLHFQIGPVAPGAEDETTVES